MDPTTSEPVSSPAPASGDRVASRLQAAVGAEPVVAWARGWVSREIPLHGLLANRTRDFVALTASSLVLVTTGFFTRRPRRRVYTVRLDELAVEVADTRRGRRVRVSPASGRPLLVDLGADARSDALVSALATRTRGDGS
jgi:hypothetical protein